MTSLPADSTQEQELKTFAWFLESSPPNQIVLVSDLLKDTHTYVQDKFRSGSPKAPQLQLYCNNEQCKGMRFFRCIDEITPRITSFGFTSYLTSYKCSNCQEVIKTFALAAKLSLDNEGGGECRKYGEWPPFGPELPSKLLKLVGSDRDLFLKGRSCENQGHGIAAFTYYRRVVEDQKNRILSEVLKVAQLLGAAPEAISALEQAIKETQFTKALDIAKDALPQSLMISGYNPLTLLHGALSDGVHNHSDDECLELAGSIRLILGELSERLSIALKDEQELAKAVAKLAARKGQQK